MVYYFFLIGLPFILLCTLLFLLWGKWGWYRYVLAVVSLFTLIMIIYVFVLGLVSMGFMLDSHFEGRGDYPSLIWSRICLALLLYVVLPLNVIHTVVWIFTKRKN